jgi:hypothetical protein
MQQDFQMMNASSYTNRPLDPYFSAYDRDSVCRVPKVLRLRTIHVLALISGAVLIAASLEWPHAWRLIALVGLTVTSLLFALAAGREWFLSQRGRLAVQFRQPLRKPASVLIVS